MAKSLHQATKLDLLKAFVKDTITSFGIVMVVKAVMVPPALGYKHKVVFYSWLAQ